MSLIIQLRGTSGSGKTTAMRKVMAAYGWCGISVPERRNPLYYVQHPTPPRPIHVLGSYESTCGGVDTIHGYETLMSLVTSLAPKGPLLMEGLLLSEDVKNTLRMPRGTLRALFLATPLEVCLERVKARRMARGNAKELNPANTSNRVATIARARARLEAAGVECRTVSADQAPKLILEWLK